MRHTVHAVQQATVADRCIAFSASWCAALSAGQLEDEGECSNITVQPKSLQAAVWAYDIYGMVLNYNSIEMGQSGVRSIHPDKGDRTSQMKA